MQRYFISPDQKKGNKIYITGNDVHHIKNVMRSSFGDHILCCDGCGWDYVVSIEEMTSEEIGCGILRVSPSQGEPGTRITVAQSLVKSEKLEWVLQKGTEIGAARFVPFVSKRSIVKIDTKKIEKKLDRWQRIVKEAAEQAHRGGIPEVSTPLLWSSLLDEIPKYETALIGYEKGGSALSSVAISERVLFIVGPEGGFSEQEIEEMEARGAVRITLGPRILRTETAPLVGVACILFQTKDMGG